MPTSAAGNPRASPRGFTLLELLVVVAIVAMASLGVGLALRDSADTALAREAQRLVALLESARAQSRLSGLPVSWRPVPGGFRFEGLAADSLPTDWLQPDTRVEFAADGGQTATRLVLGPEPIIGAQRLTLVSGEGVHRVQLATDGVRPFGVVEAAP
jgi:general secretion pathway protein H